MIKLKTGLTAARATVARFTRPTVARFTRPTVAAEPPAYVKCAGCSTAGRDDQRVPDPAQFVNKLGQSDEIVGNAAVVPAKERAEGDITLIDAAPVWCSCGRWFHAIGCYSTHRHNPSD